MRWIVCNKRLRVTTIIRFLTGVLCWSVLNSAYAEFDGSTIGIERKMNFKRGPSEVVRTRPIFVYFDKSEKGTIVVRNALRARGFSVVEDPGEGVVEIKLSGVYSFGGVGRRGSHGPLAEMLEEVVDLSSGTNLTSAHQTSNAVAVLMSAAVDLSLAPMNVAVWLGEKAGISGRFNQLLTGDPRGICFHESCGQFTSVVVVRVAGSDEVGFWWVESSAVSESLVFDLVLTDAMERALGPIFALRPGDGKQ